MMIWIGQNTEMENHSCDEYWMIVRKPENLPCYAKHVPLLSPSPELFAQYRAAVHAGIFDKRFFDTIYVPQFVHELSANGEAVALLEDLNHLSSTRDIFLGCYCEHEELCHRSIIAGILLGMHAHIQTRPEYEKYYNMYKNHCPFNQIPQCAQQ